jgi:nitroreductase
MTQTATLEQEGAVLQAIYQRRAVRSYQPASLPATTIRTLLDAAVQAPTGMHREPWAFVVVEDAARLKRYSDRAKALLARDLPRGGDHLAEMIADPEFNIFYDAPTLIVICGKPMGQWVTADCWLAAENLMLAACAMGLGTCCIGLALPVLNTAEVREELGIPREVTPVAPIILGIPSGPVPPVGRKPPEVLSWVRGSGEGER